MIKDQAKVSQIIYALGAGHSKERSTRSGSLQTVATWNNIIITTGEQPLTDEYGTTGAQNQGLGTVRKTH